MSEVDRKYYNDFAAEAKKQYEKQVIEYRATGSFTPSEECLKLDGNVWIRKHVQNKLEQEISRYPSCQFPKRPAKLDKAYNEREERSKFKRKLKDKGMLNEDGTLKDETLDFETLFQEDRESRSQKADS